MANEDPDGIPEQVRQNRPFFAVFAFAIVVAIGTFLFVLSRDTESVDIERNAPPAAETPAASTESPAAPEAPAAEPEAAAPATPPASN